MSDFQGEFEPGALVWWVVGMPGPDTDQALVTECLGPGRHKIRFKTWGQGQWHEEITTTRLWVRKAESDFAKEIEDMLSKEWERITNVRL